MRPLRQPITVSHLRLILTRLRQSNLPVIDRRLWWSACTLAYFGLLRVSEYTSPTRATTHSGTLSVDDISFNSNFTTMTVNIKASKTDPFRQGCLITIGSTLNSLCPINALRVYLSARQHPHTSPLFIFADHSFLTRGHIERFITTTLTEVNVHTHSFRIGGAPPPLLRQGFQIPPYKLSVAGRVIASCATCAYHLPLFKVSQQPCVTKRRGPLAGTFRMNMYIILGLLFIYLFVLLCIHSHVGAIQSCLFCIYSFICSPLFIACWCYFVLFILCTVSS